MYKGFKGQCHPVLLARKGNIYIPCLATGQLLHHGGSTILGFGAGGSPGGNMRFAHKRSWTGKRMKCPLLFCIGYHPLDERRQGGVGERREGAR